MKILAALLVALIGAGTAHALASSDELPALEPTHVRGLYAGRRVCPMCAHGYDAGIMVFAPASTPVEKLHTLAMNLSPNAIGISSERFRVFFILTGEPSSQQINALANDDPRWFVATLNGDALDKTERELERTFRQGTSAYVFAQRRLVHLFADDALYGTNAEIVKAQSHYAMQLLATPLSQWKRSSPNIVILASGGTAHGANGHEPVVGLPCEGCENVFVALPSILPSHARIASREEPGERLLLGGRVLNPNGSPAGNVIVYAYQTNHTGIYPRNASRVSGLRGWAQSDSEGRYQFATIRPGGYPGRSDPAHIHMHVIEPGRCTYYIDDIQFTDDPRVKSAKVEPRATARAGTGLSTPFKNNKGVWQVTRDIQLGRNIPEYDRCGTAPAAASTKM